MTFVLTNKHWYEWVMKTEPFNQEKKFWHWQASRNPRKSIFMTDILKYKMVNLQ